MKTESTFYYYYCYYLLLHLLFPSALHLTTLTIISRHHRRSSDRLRSLEAFTSAEWNVRVLRMSCRSFSCCWSCIYTPCSPTLLPGVGETSRSFPFSSICTKKNRKKQRTISAKHTISNMKMIFILHFHRASTPPEWSDGGKKEPPVLGCTHTVPTRETQVHKRDTTRET